MEPRSRHVPVASHCVLRNIKYAGDFLVVQAAEVTQFHNLAAPWIHFRQTFQSFVESNHFRSGQTRDRGSFVERNLLRAAAAFGVRVTARVIDQNTPHNLRRDGEEVRTIGPMHVPLIDETNVSLVNQRGSLQRVILPFPAHVTAGKPV